MAEIVEANEAWKLGEMGVLPFPRATARSSDLRVFAAGSLRLPLDDAIAYAARTGTKVAVVYGPSGRLRQMIEGGDVPDLFLSASIDHTAALQKAEILATSAPFTRNSLCLTAAPGIPLDGRGALDTMLDPKLRLGTSTPKADPLGDYTWEMFRRADKVRPGAYDTLSAKALQLTGKDVAKEEKALPYPALFEGERKTDLFVTYCTNAIATAARVPGLAWIRLPPELDVSATYGAGVSAKANVQTGELLQFLESPGGRAIFERYGFR